MASAHFPDGHFSHIFIDEAGHATEAEALITISGILSNDHPGQLVLAGDPKQLGPVLRSPISLKYGLQISLLERLMTTTEVFQRDTETEEFNSKAITKLLNNFRSHESLLKLPSSLFYESELKAKADHFVTDDMINWSKLPNRYILFNSDFD
jgi:helicase MOV-10